MHAHLALTLSSQDHCHPAPLKGSPPTPTPCHLPKVSLSTCCKRHQLPLRNMSEAGNVLTYLYVSLNLPVQSILALAASENANTPNIQKPPHAHNTATLLSSHRIRCTRIYPTQPMPYLAPFSTAPTTPHISPLACRLSPPGSLTPPPPSPAYVLFTLSQKDLSHSIILYPRSFQT